MTATTDALAFSEDQRRVLARVLDEIIPPSDDGRLPGAGQLGVAGDVDRALTALPDLRAMIVEGLAELEAAARQQDTGGFAALSRQDKVRLLNQQAFVLPLSMQAYVGYYQHPRIVAALGLETHAPHPKGYAMATNDFSLLEAVRKRAAMYRR